MPQTKQFTFYMSKISLLLTQAKLINYFTYSIIADFADDPSFTWQVLHYVYVRGRHNPISTTTATQQQMLAIPAYELMEQNFIFIW